MPKIILCRGIQGSGKTTWAKHRVRFNNDDIRNMLGKYWIPSREPMVAAMKDGFVEEAILLRLDMVVDNMNNNKEIEYWKNWANLHNYDLEFKNFQDCIERDSKRPNPIGEEVIRKTYEKYKNILEDGKDNSSKDTSGSLCSS
jgi:tRNA uridine 5-carbamoylmethylation protein Kti12